MSKYIIRNYGYAHSIERAVQLIAQVMSRGFGSVHVRMYRLQHFIDFLKQCGIKDLRKMTYADLQNFGCYIEAQKAIKGWSPAYAKRK